MPEQIHITKINAASLDKVNTDLADFLAKNGFSVTHNQIPMEGKVLINHYFQVAKAGRFFKKSILIQPIDGTIFKDGVTAEMNKYDLITTSSAVSKSILEKNGVTKPIAVVPYYYDERILSSNNGYYARKYKSDKYTFYNESSGIKRKNLNNTLRYFLSEFTATDNVRLILKLSTKDNNIIDEINAIYNQINANGQAPEVVIINEFLSEDDLNSLRRGINCYICLSYMEGFCIPLLNAVVLKKDVICLNSKISGYADFINDKNACLLEAHSIPIDKHPSSLLIFAKESLWEEPSYADYQQALRKVYTKKHPFSKDEREYNRYSSTTVMNQYLNIINNIENDAWVRGMASGKNDICVIVHLYYTDMLDQIISYLKNIRHDYNLIITVVNHGADDGGLKDKILRFKPTAIIIPVQAKGMDITPFLIAYKQIPPESKYILKIHTKKSVSAGGNIGSDWFKSLMEHTLGSDKLVDDILWALENTNIGMVGDRIRECGESLDGNGQPTVTKYLT